MSAPNFMYLKNFDILAHECCYELEDIGEYEFDYQLCDMIEDELKTYNDKLNFFKLTIKGGYFSGIQIVPVPSITAEDILDYYNDVNSEDIFAMYGYNKHILKLKIQKEIRYINTTIFDKLKDNFGFERLGVIARFSNGETMYGRI